MNAPKVCCVCGRHFSWRKKWAANWEQVRYCSDACRRRGLKPIDRRIEAALLECLDQRPAGSTICPSEVARRLAYDETEWRALLEPIRMAARRLHQAGVVEVTQSGRKVDPSSARGPIRIRRSWLKGDHSGCT